jgi:hypothetical protein
MNGAPILLSEKRLFLTVFDSAVTFFLGGSMCIYTVAVISLFLLVIYVFIPDCRG